ncbi:MAG: hypothetical protein ACERKO_10605 [Acetanaerobacterium sp.]
MSRITAMLLVSVLMMTACAPISPQAASSASLSKNAPQSALQQSEVSKKTDLEAYSLEEIGLALPDCMPKAAIPNLYIIPPSEEELSERHIFVLDSLMDFSDYSFFNIITWMEVYNYAEDHKQGMHAPLGLVTSNLYGGETLVVFTWQQVSKPHPSPLGEGDKLPFLLLQSYKKSDLALENAVIYLPERPYTPEEVDAYYFNTANTLPLAAFTPEELSPLLVYENEEWAVYDILPMLSECSIQDFAPQDVDPAAYEWLSPAAEAVREHFAELVYQAQ